MTLEMTTMKIRQRLVQANIRHQQAFPKRTRKRLR